MISEASWSKEEKSQKEMYHKGNADGQANPESKRMRELFAQCVLSLAILLERLGQTLTYTLNLAHMHVNVRADPLVDYLSTVYRHHGGDHGIS